MSLAKPAIISCAALGVIYLAACIAYEGWTWLSLAKQLAKE